MSYTLNHSERFQIGIDQLSFYIPRYKINLDKLAVHRGFEPEKFKNDLGQESMGLIPPNEDIVTMAVNACLPIVDEERAKKIKLVLFATESAIDQAKAAGIYIHHYLGLPADCRVMELKQACYSLTGALQLARAMISLNPDDEVLIIGSDVAKYELNSVAEPTQGAGAAAMIISKDPCLLAVEPESGVFTQHVMDFWRPPYSSHAFVSPQYSVRFYLQAMEKAWKNYSAKTNYDKDDIDLACYHTPFIRMAENVHGKFRGNTDRALNEIAPATIYGRQIGNTYTAALYISLCSMLENSKAESLAGKRVGMFSYGSGAVSEYFAGVVQPGYTRHLNVEKHRNLLSSVKSCDIDTYQDFYNYSPPQNGQETVLRDHDTGALKIQKFADHKRYYEWAQKAGQNIQETSSQRNRPEPQHHSQKKHLRTVSSY